MVSMSSTYLRQMNSLNMDLIVGATKDDIMMVEVRWMRFWNRILLALWRQHEAIKPMCGYFLRRNGTDVKREYDDRNQWWTYEQVRETCDALYAEGSAVTTIKHREETYENQSDFIEAYDAHTDLSETTSKKNAKIGRCCWCSAWLCFVAVFSTLVSVDGRATDEIRPIWCGMQCHGSLIFQRWDDVFINTLGIRWTKMVDNVLNELSTLLLL